jgi:hypothetical protein
VETYLPTQYRRQFVNGSFCMFPEPVLLPKVACTSDVLRMCFGSATAQLRRSYAVDTEDQPGLGKIREDEARMNGG